MAEDWLTELRVGARLRELRDTHRVSQQELANRAQVSVVTVRRIEQGGRGSVSMPTLHALARALDLPLYELLGGARTLQQQPPDPKVTSSKTEIEGRDMGSAVRIVHVIANPLEWEMWDKTKRRNFLVQAAGTVAAILAALDRRSDVRRIGLDIETLEGLEQTTLGLRRAYRSTGAFSLLGPSHGTLNLLTEMVPRSGKHQNRVVTAIGQVAALIGTMLSLDLGDFEAGGRYLSLAARAAQQANNYDLLAFTLGARAFQTAYSGDPRAGRDYADSALGIATRGASPVTHGWLSAVASEMHAIDRDEDKCRQLLDEAATHLASADPAEPWTGVGVFNTEKLMAYRGGDLMRLGRYAEAQDALHQALDRLAPSLAKHRCTAYIDLAEAYAAGDKIDEAVEHVAEAIPILTDTRHAASLRRVERLHERLHKHQSSATQRLGEELMQMRATW